MVSDYKHDFFKSWTRPMSYCLGFLMADGCMGINDCENYFIQCSIHEKDKEVIQYLINNICPNREIRYHQATQKSGKITHYARCKFTSNELCSSAIEKGLIPAKTGKKKLCEIPTEYRGDYLRGLFDGDGNIYYDKKRNSYRFRIASKNKDYLDKIRYNIGNNMGKVVLGHHVYDWEITKKTEIIQIMNLMYNNHEFCLNRKYKIFQEMCSNPKYYLININKKLMPRKFSMSYDEIYKRYSNGQSVQDIAKDFGCKIATIYRRLNEYKQNNLEKS